MHKPDTAGRPRTHIQAWRHLGFQGCLTKKGRPAAQNFAFQRFCEIEASGLIANRKLHGEIWPKLVAEMGVVTGDFEVSPSLDIPS